MTFSISVINREAKAVSKDLSKIGLRPAVADEVSSYLIASTRLQRPMLLHQYLVWRFSYESQRGSSPDQLERDVKLLISSKVDLPEVLKQEIETSFQRLRQEQDLEPKESKANSVYEIQGSTDQLANHIIMHLIDGNRRQVTDLIIAEVQAGLAIEDLYVDVLQLVLYKIGELWQRNKLSVGQEHFCTAAIQSSMAQLYPYIFANERNDDRIVAASVTGNLHEVGIRMVADIMELHGWDAYYVGANCPINDLISIVETKQANVLAVSATGISQLDALERLIKKTKSCLGEDFPILVGGYLFNAMPDLWVQIGATGFTDNCKDVVKVAERIKKQAS